MMVHDDDVALLRLLVHQRDEAAAELLAFLPAAQVPPRVQLGPCLALLRQCPDFGPIAELGGLFPLPDDLKIRRLFESGQNRLPFCIVNFLPACIVAAPFHVTHLEWTLEVLL